ncbi:MAG TPA: FUSC family protein, partial [Telluria sp.]
VATWLKLSRLEGTSTAADCAALGQAAASSTAILLAVDLVAREPGARLPDALSASLSATLEQMAGMLDAGGYPVDIVLDLPEVAALAPLASLVWADLRIAIEGFAVPDAGPAPARDLPVPARDGFFDPDAWSNPDHLRYALKTTAAAMFCYLLYQQLDWPGIHTCFITCYMVSLGTTAETVEKLTLRIAGCLVGALLGTLAIVFVIPGLSSVGELIALVFAGAWLAAWVATGGPRIAYAGMQIALAFFLCVVQGAAPAFNLLVARDRVIGVLLGNVVVYLVFTRVWPVSIEKRVDALLSALIAQWRAIAHSADAGPRRTGAAGALARFGELRQNLGLVHYEPSWVRPGSAWIASRRRALAELRALEAPLFFAAGRAQACTDARLGQVAERIGAGDADAPAEQPGRACAEASSADALMALIDARLARIAEAAPSSDSTEATSDAHP